MFEELEMIEEMVHELTQGNQEDMERLSPLLPTLPSAREEQEQTSRETSGLSAERRREPPDPAADPPPNTLDAAANARIACSSQSKQPNKRSNAYDQEETDQERPRDKRGTTERGHAPRRGPPRTSLEMHFPRTSVPPPDVANTRVLHTSATDIRNDTRRNMSTLENEETPENNREREEATPARRTRIRQRRGTNSTTNQPHQHENDEPRLPRVTEINQMIANQAVIINTEHVHTALEIEYGRRRRRPPDKNPC
jgi:hypothetical protein